MFEAFLAHAMRVMVTMRRSHPPSIRHGATLVSAAEAFEPVQRGVVPASDPVSNRVPEGDISLIDARSSGRCHFGAHFADPRMRWILTTCSPSARADSAPIAQFPTPPIARCLQRRAQFAAVCDADNRKR